MTPLRGCLVSAVCFVATFAACNGEFRFDEVRPVAVPAPDASDASVESIDADAGPSVRCTNDVACRLSTLRCELGAGQCVECLEDAQCTAAGATRCDTTLHRCVQCGRDDDCGPREICEPLTRRCVPTCTPADQTCPVGFEGCAETIGRCIKCREDVQCTSTQQPHCDTNIWQCAACARDEQCTSSTTPRCDRRTGRCASCLTSADCTGFPPICDPATLTCATK